MSRIGLKPISLPTGVDVKVSDRLVTVKGPKGELQERIDSQIEVALSGKNLIVKRSSDEKRVCALHGTVRSKIMNMVTGVTQGFERVLEITGVGYRAALQGKSLSLSLGFSHPIVFDLPKGVEAQVEKQTVIILRGIDRYLVGQAAANLRRLRPPEPYKGKGVKYKDEQIRRKEGKTGK